MPSDLPIPAPTLWYALVPTDQPVLPRTTMALRNIERGTWVLYHPGAAPMLSHVVDDHGQLVPLGPELEHAAWATWACSEDFEAAGTAWWEDRMAEARAESIRQGAARATRALLRPAPVQAELVLAPEDYPSCAAAITIGGDERMRDAAAHTPQYQVSCDHQSMTLTHAQLCALVLAAHKLIGSAHRPREARLQ